MFTVKLMTARQDALGVQAPSTDLPAEVRFSTKLVEATEVYIHWLRAGQLAEIATPTAAFYVADRNKGRPAGFADEIEFYYAAYIENSAGKTTEVVQF